MMKYRLAILLFALILIAGCAGTGAKKINALRLGMSRAEVIQTMGEPNSTSEIAGTLYLRYHLASAGLFTDEYYVRLMDGKVDAYGKRGDFGLGY